MPTVQRVCTPEGDYWDLSLGDLEARTLLRLLRNGGPPRGPRGLINAIIRALQEAGVRPRKGLLFRGRLSIEETRQPTRKRKEPKP